jgi:hypothetical protein
MSIHTLSLYEHRLLAYQVAKSAVLPFEAFGWPSD